MIKQKWLKLKRRWFPYLFAYSAKMAIRMLLKTCRINLHGLDTFIKTAENSPCMLMLWHSKLVLVSEILNTYAPQFIYTAFISKSRDGDPLARLATSYKSGRALRVPHDARHLALNQLIASIKNKGEIIIITPDGPRGPKQEIKPGIILAARQTEANVFPFSWSAKSFWQLNTWDRMRIPKPFTSINVYFGDSIILTGEAKVFENEASTLKNSLDTLEQ